MDRALLLQLLVQAERDVAAGERKLARQREIITTLERDGHDATKAVALLAQLNHIQAMRVADRDGLVQDLTERPADPRANHSGDRP